jgi:hypothetical protein
MAKATAKKTKKRIVKRSALTGGIIEKDFRFPSKNSVKVIGSNGLTGAQANTGVKKLRQTYKSAGYSIMGTTGDGVVIVRPAGAPKSFKLDELKRAFSNAKHTKSGRAS